MAVIQSEEIGIAGIKYKRVIKCDSHGTFSTELPDFIAYKLQISRVIKAKTKELLLGEWKKLVGEFYSLQTSTKKVILYCMQFSAYITAGNKVVLHAKQMSFSDGMALDLAVGVYEQRTVVGKGEYDVRVSYEYLKSAIPAGLALQNIPRHDDIHTTSKISQDNVHDDSPFLMEWTEKNEAFFAAIGTALENLILKLSAITKDPQALQQKILTGKMPKLLG